MKTCCDCRGCRGCGDCGGCGGCACWLGIDYNEKKIDVGIQNDENSDKDPSS